MLHKAGLLRCGDSNISTYLYIGKTNKRGDAGGSEKRCDTPPWKALLAAAAKFPQLSRLTRRRQTDARLIG